MLKIDFINVGYGDSILLRNLDKDNESFCMLVDAGDCIDNNYLESDTRIKAIDFLTREKVEKIDLLVISHLHLDHVGGLLDIAKNLHIEELWVNYMFNHEFVGKQIECSDTYTDGAKNLVSSINRYNKSISTLMKKGTLIKEIIEPFKTGLYRSLEVDVLCCDREKLNRQREIIDNLYTDGDMEKNGNNLAELDTFINNTSIVLDITYKSKNILLGADAYISYWDNKAVPSCDILKIPHHGHKDGINKQLILQMSPSYVVISVSNTRTDDCPSRECIKAMRQCINPPCDILCTDAVNMPPFFEGSKQKSVSFEIDETGQIYCKQHKQEIKNFRY